MSKYTKGPWQVDPNTGVVFDQAGLAVQTGGKNFSEESQANARLIASCPDLLHACKIALGAIPPECALTRDKLERAIKKAVGE